MYTDDYFRYYTPKNNTIWLDAGCCRGEFIRQYAHHIRNMSISVLAIEPNPYLAESLWSQLEDEFISDRITFIQKALSDKNEVALFNIADNDNASALSCDFQYDAIPYALIKKAAVETITIDSILSTYNNIDFVKMDIEGSELRVLRSCTMLYEKVNNLSIAAYHAYPNTFYSKYIHDIKEWIDSGRVTKEDVKPLLFAATSSELSCTHVYLIPFLKYIGYYTVMSKQLQPILYASKTII